MNGTARGVPDSTSSLPAAGPAWAVWAVMFVPGHLFEWAVEWAWLGVHLAVATVAALTLGRPLRAAAGVSPAGWLALASAGSVLAGAATLFGHLRLGAPISNADLPDLLRFAIYLPLALSVGAAVGRGSLRSVDMALRCVVVFNLVTAAVLLAGVPGLHDAIMLLYGEAKVQYEEGHIRIGIPFTNPNFAALVFVLLLAYFLFYRPSMLFGALTLVSLLLTGSRSGWIAAAPILVLAYLRLVGRAISMRHAGALAFCVALHLVPLYYLAELLELAEGLSRLQELAESLQGGALSDVKTADVRFEVFDVFAEYIARSPWLGWGPGRALGLDIADSQFLSWAALFGVPAAVGVSLFFAWLFVGPMWRARQRAHQLALLATAASFMLMLATGDFMKNYRLFLIAVLMAHCIGLLVTAPGTAAAATATPDPDAAAPARPAVDGHC